MKGSGSRAAIVGVLVAGLALRVAAEVVLWPAHMTHPSFGDAGSFVEAARSGLFDDPSRTAGYPAFLRGVHLVSDAAWPPIVLQHLLGLCAALLFYLTSRRLGLGRGASLVPAAAAALSGDQLFLEHTYLSDAFFTTVLAGALYAVARAATSRSLAWVAATGLAVGAASLVRSVGVVLVLVVGAWLLWAWSGRRRGRLAAAAVAVLAALAVLAGDAALRAASTSFAGFSPTGGRSL